MTEAGNIYRLPDPKAAEAEAALWVARLDGGEMTAEDYAAFAQWRAESDHNRDAYERYARLWTGLDSLEDLSNYASTTGSARPSLRRRLARALPMLAAVLVAAVAIGLFANGFGNWRPVPVDEPPLVFASTYRTDVGARDVVELPDGSRLTLNTDSRIAARFTPRERRIRLLHGEAFFEVAPDRSRPFSVYAGNGVVRAVGTAFSVRLNVDKLDVMVSEGRVALAALARPAAESSTPAKAVMELTAGQSAVFDARHVETLDHVTPAEIDRRLSWRDGMLAFAGEPLSEVVVEVGRYSSVDIEIRGDALRDIPIAGYFKAGEVDAFVEALHIMTGIQVTEAGPGHLVLSPPE